MIHNRVSDFLLYKAADGKVRVELLFRDENFWLTRADMGELFQVGRVVIGRHLKDIFDEGELRESSVCANFADAEFYSLDAIIAVAYRVRSKRATQFRAWTLQVLKEYGVKGFALDDERLKQGASAFGEDYFDELLEIVGSIRRSERQIYQKITDIFAECSMDYDPASEVAKSFYSLVLNRFYFSIVDRASIRKSPPKDSLSEDEVQQLGETLPDFFDYIESLFKNHQAFTMKEFVESADKFLSPSKYKILQN